MSNKLRKPSALHVTAGQILAADGAFAVLLKSVHAPMVAFRIAVLMARLKPEMEAANLARMNACLKHGEKQGDQIVVPPEKLAALNEDLGPMLDLMVDVDAKPLSIDVIEQVGPILTPAQMMTLLPFIEEQ